MSDQLHASGALLRVKGPIVLTGQEVGGPHSWSERGGKIASVVSLDSNPCTTSDTVDILSFHQTVLVPYTFDAGVSPKSQEHMADMLLTAI
jgi:hypothetical protein